MNVQIHPRFMLLLILTSFSEVNSAPVEGAGARWWSDGEGDPQASLQSRSTTCSGGLQWQSSCFSSSSVAEAWGNLGLILIWSSPIQLSPYEMYK